MYVVQTRDIMNEGWSTVTDPMNYQMVEETMAELSDDDDWCSYPYSEYRTLKVN